MCEISYLHSPSPILPFSYFPFQLLATVFQEFLTRKEDYLRALRGFLRELVRQVRNEFNFATFARSLMQERPESDFTQLEQTHKV